MLTYIECQIKTKFNYEKSLFPTYTSVLFEKIHINIVKMPKWNEKIYIIITKKDLSG